MKSVWFVPCLLLTLWPLDAFSQERRDPTVPGAAIGQKLQQAVIKVEVADDSPLVLKALVLRDADHGMALLQTSSGTIRVPLDRSQPGELVVNGRVCMIIDFTAGTIRLRSGNQVRTLSTASHTAPSNAR